MNTKNLKPSLLLCLVLDGIGMLSYSVLGLGETVDLIWAPISALLMLKLFGGKTGKAGAILSFIEEIIPFATDIIPSFTIMYLVSKFTGVFSKNETSQEGKVVVIK